MNYRVTYSKELYHHGILGQKWGVRRYRNEDGTLTPAGKKRYGALTRNNGSIDYAKKSSKEARKRFKNDKPLWNKADEYAFSKTGELNKTEVGKKFSKYVDSGTYYDLGPNGYEVISDDFNKTIDAMDAFSKYQKEIRKIMTDAFDNNVDYLLTANGYKVTEEGREYAKEYLKNTDTYKFFEKVDPVKTYNIYKRRSGN